ncbi:hypothetical protein Tco_1362250 [Tanacetum coccineum]
MINDVSLTCDTSLEIFHDEFNRFSNMDNDLFTYEVEIARIANVLCYLNKDVIQNNRCHKNLMMIWSMFHLMSSLLHGDNEVVLTDEESFDSDDEDEVAKIFRIETNVFDFETPLCRAFKEFNYLLHIDPDVLTNDIEGFKTYEEYKDDCGYSEWPTFSWREDGYCNAGNLPGAYIDELMKMMNQVLMVGEDGTTMRLPTIIKKKENEHEDEERYELFDDHELPAYTIRRFEIRSHMTKSMLLLKKTNMMI